MTIVDGWQIGSESEVDGTTAQGSPSNIRFAPGDGIQLVVPGGQSTGGETTGAEIYFSGDDDFGMTSFVAEAELMMSASPGTCQSMFTFTADFDTSSDEQDIEVIAPSMMKDTAIAKAGVQLTNHNPEESGENDFMIQPFPRDPTIGYHTYCIAWLDDSVTYGFDGVPWKSPTKYVSINPSFIILNHWATGDEAFFQAPMPAEDVIMKAKSLRVWYKAAASSDPSDGCTEADACVI